MAVVQLSAFEHIQRRPEMYIGTTQTPIHLLYEIIDNAADEAINGKANEIRVYVNYDTHEYSVTDNGRGIPITSPTLDRDVPIVIATTLYSGGKFDNDLYSYHSGLHGMGLAIVNALSDSMSFEIYHKKKQYIYKFYNSEDPDQVISECKTVKTQAPFSTKTFFKPSEKFFDTLDIDESIIESRLKGILLSVEKDLSIYLIITKQGVTTEKKIEDTFLNDYLSKCEPIVFDMSGIRTDNEGHQFTDTMKVYVGFEEDYKYSKFFSVVNSLPITSGNHSRFLESTIKDYMWEYGQKAKRNVKKEDMLMGSNIFAILTLSDPGFSSQDKQALTGKTGKYSHLFDKDKLIKILKKNNDFFDRWLDYCESYRMSKDSKDISSLGKKTRNRVAIEGLRDCSSNVINERELFIVEGQSAGGTLLQARDTKIHAVLPLRGKILNVMNSSYQSILASKTLASIFKSVGIALTSATKTDFRYGKVIIAADEDVDGSHIRALLLSFFYKYGQSLIEDGRLYVAKLPLFGCHYKGAFIPINSKEDLEKYRSLKCDIHRYKGLGEMDKDELGPCMFGPSRILVKVTPNETETVENIWDTRDTLINEFVTK